MEYLEYNHIFNIVKNIENKFMNKLTTFKLITYKNKTSKKKHTRTRCLQLI